MAVTPGSYRLGDWKLRFARGGAGSVDRTVADAVLHNLSEDPAEEEDLSDTQSEMKTRLFEEYQQIVAERKLKPLAAQVFANKSQKKKRSPNPKKNASPPRGNQNGKRPNPARGALQVPSDVQLSEEQKTKVEALVVEYRRKIAELRASLTNVLTDEQTQTRAVAKKKALEEGKKGMTLRQVVDAAAKLTDEQKKQIQNLRQAMANVTRESREKLLEMLTDDQRAKLESPGKK